MVANIKKSPISDQFFIRNSLQMLNTITFVNSQKFNSSLSLSVKTILVCHHNNVTLIDVELHGKGSTDCENSDKTSCVIISRSGLEIFVYINRIMTKLWR